MKKLLVLSIIGAISFLIPTFAYNVRGNEDLYSTEFGVIRREDNFRVIETIEEMKERMKEYMGFEGNAGMILLHNENLFPDWESYNIPTSVLDYNELTYNNESNIDRFASFSDYVNIPLQTNEKSSDFYIFDAIEHEYVLVWASDLPDDLKVNIALTNLDTNTSVGWIPNMQAGQVASFPTSNGVRFGVRVSSANREEIMTLNVLGIN